MMWEIRQDKPHDEYWIEFRDPDGWYEAIVKWDGCIHLYRAANVPFDDVSGHSEGPRGKEACDSYVHICDVDDMILRLQSLKKAAQTHFGSEWSV